MDSSGQNAWVKSQLELLTMQDTLRWQGPALALTAQSFLLTIALGKDSTGFARFLAAFLGLCSCFAAFNLVRRKSIQVEQLRDNLEKEGLSLQFVDVSDDSLGSTDSRVKRAFKQGWPAAKVWATVLFIFMLADIAIIVLVFLGLSGLFTSK